MAEDILEAEHVQCADRWIQSVCYTLLDGRRRLAPGNRGRVCADQTVVLLQHLRARYAELHASQIGRRENSNSAALTNRDNPRVDHDVEQGLEALGLNLRVDVADPRVGVHQVGEALVRTTKVRQVDQVNRRREGRKVGQRVLCRLNGTALHLLHQCTTGTKLTARCELHVDLAVGGVLDVLFQVQLHDRVAARRAQNVGGGNQHGVISCSFALALFSRGLRNGLLRPQRPGRTGNHSRGETTGSRELEEITAGRRLQLSHRVILLHQLTLPSHRFCGALSLAMTYRFEHQG